MIRAEFNALESMYELVWGRNQDRTLLTVDGVRHWRTLPDLDKALSHNGLVRLLPPAYRSKRLELPSSWAVVTE